MNFLVSTLYQYIAVNSKLRKIIFYSHAIVRLKCTLEKWTHFLQKTD